MEIFPFSFTEYSTLASVTDRYRDDQRMLCCSLGLVSEAGEFAGKVEKHYRKYGAFVPDDDARRHMALELGDVLWDLAGSIRAVSVTLPYIVRAQWRAQGLNESNAPTTFDEYQQTVSQFNVAPEAVRPAYAAMLLADDVNDYNRIVARAILNGDTTLKGIDADLAAEVFSEILADLAACATLIGYDLSAIARMNIDKLTDRNRRSNSGNDIIASVQGGDNR